MSERTAADLRQEARDKRSSARRLNDQAGDLLNEAAALDRKAQEAEMAEAAKVPVDRNARVLVSGKTEAEAPDYRDLKENGQQKDYVVLSEAERAKGFVRPVRRSYIHEKCRSMTTMSQALAETYARDPGFYSGTFCVGCGAHFPVGADGEFVWVDGGEKVGT
jgi:hypothetical protein